MSLSHRRRVVVVPSSHRRLNVVLLSSHRGHIVVVSSFSWPPRPPSSYSRKHTRHLQSIDNPFPDNRTARQRFAAYGAECTPCDPRPSFGQRCSVFRSLIMVLVFSDLSFHSLLWWSYSDKTADFSDKCEPVLEIQPASVKMPVCGCRSASQTSLRRWRKSKCVCMYVCMHACMHGCMYVCMD